MKKHFVIFYSPGTLVAEQDRQEIDSWDIDKAVKMSGKIKQRHGATPYGFRFITRGRKDNELDSEVINESKMYFLGGKVLTLQDVIDRNDPEDRILISNMKGNNIKKVIVNDNSWRVTMPLGKGDTVLGAEHGY
jgi:hypothetical protein